MRVRLLASLLTTDDVESAARRDDAINECLAGVLRYNNLLYTGAKNIPSAGQLDHKAVRRGVVFNDDRHQFHSSPPHLQRRVR